MMREVRTIEPQSKSLEGYLEAFTFTGSSMLELEAEVETCLEFCKPVLCQIPTGRREDDTETVSSFGRKKRESGVSEEVLSSVTLSRSVAVQAEDFSSVKSLVPENYASPVTAPSPLDVKGNGIFQTFDSKAGNSDSTFCFDPTIFTLIAGGFFLVEVCGFSACLIAGCRWRKKNTKTIVNKKRHLSIHYENSVDGS
ncbi:ZP domain-containing protein [Trichonephila clavipes]|nr:ZP domain-containing protein [Trichonephila clavipes]